MSEHDEDMLWLQSRCPWREGTESAERWYGEQREAVDRILTRLEAAEADRDALQAGVAILMSEAQQGARFVHFEFFDGSSNTYPIDVILPPTTTPRG